MSKLDDFLSKLKLIGSDPDAETIAPTIIVKVLDAVVLAGIDKGATLTLDALATQASAPDSAALQNLHSTVPSLVFSWAFVSVTMADINGLIARATANDATYEAPQFDHYFEIICPNGVDNDSLVTALNAWSDVVEYSYAVQPAEDAGIVGTDNPHFINQDYFAAAPVGISAQAAWDKNADGSGLNLTDIERGWFLTHQDLPQTITLQYGTNETKSFNHGVAVLGEIVGLNNKVGIVGAAPNATVNLYSFVDSLPSSNRVDHLPDRIMVAAYYLNAGDVILIETTQRVTVNGIGTQWPVEIQQLSVDVIKFAIRLGVIVVEAAGNGNANLDTFVMDHGGNKGKKTLSRSNPADFQDSGAIMVGACRSALPHARWESPNQSSNFGSRIDCYAWGENIVTTGWDPTNPSATNLYSGVTLPFFGGTSGASAIIAGCCLLVQSLRGLLTPKSGPPRLDSFGMRQLLSDPNNGTASFELSDQIGVMPDLEKIIANEFNP